MCDEVGGEAWDLGVVTSDLGVVVVISVPGLSTLCRASWWHDSHRSIAHSKSQNNDQTSGCQHGLGNTLFAFSIFFVVIASLDSPIQ